MELSERLFAVDCSEEVQRITAFIRDAMGDLRRDEVVVAISGGLDSSTVLALCARAVGAARVTGLMLPEKHGNPDALKYARLVTDALGVTPVKIDISAALQALGTYAFIADRIVSRRVVGAAVNQLPLDMKKNLFLAGIRGGGNALVRQAMAAMYSKHRVRAVALFKYAEERNLLVAGCAHLSEDMVGLFSKFGVDDLADIMPIKHLYRSQVVNLARCLGVPDAIIARVPNPDMMPGIDDKYRDVLGIDPGLLDLMLYGLRHHLPHAEIARQLGVEPALVDEIAALVRDTAHMRRHSVGIEG